jgi:hypothetical protein
MLQINAGNNFLHDIIFNYRCKSFACKVTNELAGTKNPVRKAMNEPARAKSPARKVMNKPAKAKSFVRKIMNGQICPVMLKRSAIS